MQVEASTTNNIKINSTGACKSSCDGSAFLQVGTPGEGIPVLCSCGFLRGMVLEADTLPWDKRSHPRVPVYKVAIRSGQVYDPPSLLLSPLVAGSRCLEREGLLLSQCVLSWQIIEISF